MNRLVLLCGMLLAFANVKAADEELSPEEIAARDFSFEKIKLGSALDDFKKRFPNATIVNEATDQKLKLAAYSAEAKAASKCSYYFVDGKLYEIRISYESKLVKEMGGHILLLSKITDKFGKFGNDKLTIVDKPFKIDGERNFPKVNRMIIVLGNVDEIVIDVTDMIAYREVEKRKKGKIKTGFDD